MNSLFKNNIILLTILFLLVVSLPIYASQSFEGTKLRVALPRGYDECVAFSKAAEIAAGELGIELDILWYTVDQLHDKLLIDYKMSNPAWDITFVATTSQAEWMELGLITPVGRFIKNNPDLVNTSLLGMDDFHSQSIEDFTYKGEWIGFPLYLTGVALHYRKDLFNDPEERKAFKEKYGYELNSPQTYEKYYDVAEFFTRKAGENLAGKVLKNDFYGISHSNKPTSFLWYDYVNVFRAFGAEMYNSDTLKPTFNSPESINAAKYYVSLVPFLPPGHMSKASGEATALFAEGRVAMQVEYFQRFTSMVLNPEKCDLAQKVGFTALPSVEGVEGRKHAAHFGGNAISLFSLSEHKAAAYKLLEKAFSAKAIKEVLLTDFANGGWVPPRLSIFEDQEVNKSLPWLSEAKKQLLDREDIDYFQLPQLPIYFACIDICATAISESLSGQKPVPEALNQAQKKLEDLFGEAGY